MKNNTAFLLLVLIVSVLIALSSCTKEDDTFYGQSIFEITVPSGWMSQWYNDENLMLYAWSPLRVDDDEAMLEDTINEDLVITREYLPALDLEVYYTSIVTLLQNENSYRQVYASDTVINGESAKKLIYTQNIRLPSNTPSIDSVDLEVKPMKFVFFRDEYGYIIDCGMVPYTYPYYKPIFEEAISSFQFKN